MTKLKNIFQAIIRYLTPNSPKKFSVRAYKIRFRFKGVIIMKHIVRLSWVESVGTKEFPIVSQHLKASVGDVALVDVDVPVGTNTFDFVVDPEVDVHCELVASNGVFTSDPAVLDFHTPAFPPVATKPDAPTNLAVEFIGKEE